MTATTSTLHGSKLLVAAAISLWSVEVCLNLGLVERVFLGPELPGGTRDYLGLLIADAQIAVALVAASGLAALVFGRRGNRAAEVVALLAAVLAAVTLFAGVESAWRAVPRRRFVLAAAAGAGLLVWIAVRSGFARRASGRLRLGEILLYTLCPALALGLANRALARSAAGVTSASWLHGVAALCVLALGLLGSGQRFARVRVSLGWLPAACAVALAVASAQGLPGRWWNVRSEPATVEAERPPIFLVVLDTVRADHLALYGYARDTMPALGRWAAGALVADRAVSASGWTTPAHASIFSGRTVSRHGIHNVAASGGTPGAAGGFADRRGRVFATSPLPGIDWLPERLAREGYRCLAITANPAAVMGVSGFDRIESPDRSAWFSSSAGATLDSLSPISRRISERLRWRMPYVDARGMADLAMRVVGASNAAPLFVFLNLLDAHAPYNPPAQALSRLGVEVDPGFPRYWHHVELTRRWASLPEGAQASLIDLYDGELRGLDLQLERLLEWIDRRHGAAATVIVTSDHGEELGEEGRVGHEYGLAQRLIHVPLLIRSPGLAPGRLSDPVSTRNLYEFVAAVASGRGARPDLLVRHGEHGLISERYPSRRIVGELGPSYDRAWVSLIDAGFKAVGPSEDGFDVLDVDTFGFDRELPTRRPAVAAALRARIDRYWSSQRDRRPDAAADVSDEDREALRALGYGQ